MLLEELKGNQDLLDRLTQHDYGNYQTASFHVSQWFKQQNKDRNLWRFKNWDLADKGLHYRIVYAFLPKSYEYYVLAITSRKDMDYDNETDPLTRRITSDYEELC